MHGCTTVLRQMTGVAGAVGLALVWGWLLAGIRPRRLGVRSFAAAIAGTAAVTGETLLLASTAAAAVVVPVAAGSTVVRVALERAVATPKGAR